MCDGRRFVTSAHLRVLWVSMRKFRSNHVWGTIPKGAILDESQLPPGTDIERSIQRGTITPLENGVDTALADDDGPGWKARAEIFEKENQELRTATADAKTLAQLKDLRKENEELKVQLQSALANVAMYEAGSVPKAQYKNVNDRLNQIVHLHETTSKELEELRGKKHLARA